MEAAFDDLLAAPSSGGEHNNIMLAASITGGENSPPTPPDANDPGLESNQTQRGFSMKWLWIILGALVLLFGAWYFGLFGSSTPSA